jgi:nitroreductase family protein
MNFKTLQKAAQARRSIYALNKNLSISIDEINHIVEHALLHTPSSFNSQSTRMVILHNAEHDKLWDLTKDALRKIIPTENFSATEHKLNGFKAAAGTILFFEDMTVIKNLQEQFPSYAENFPIWADHANAMNQYAIWTTLASENIGANLQHYNPIIDKAVANTWGISDHWKLRAQLVFGGITEQASEKTFVSIDERLKIFS